MYIKILNKRFKKIVDIIKRKYKKNRENIPSVFNEDKIGKCILR
jgi:hypothetical protein